ncbi:MAG: TlpA family protein disulfide reductase, partial [Gammaproteobacteria bacterium]|nr:TlpA family protein disulfide reductase [Gammaproteobacteria bacterium]
MIQTAALHLGVFMIPWPLVFLLLGLVVVFIVGKFFQRRYTWDVQTWARYQDALWN